jgi:hypothetical protein
VSRVPRRNNHPGSSVTTIAPAIEEVLRRRQDGDFSYFVVGANVADVLAPVVAELAGR